MMSKLVKSQAVCEMFDISVSTLYLWVKAGKLPKPMVAHNRRYWKAEELKAVQEKMFSDGEVSKCTAD